MMTLCDFCAMRGVLVLLDGGCRGVGRPRISISVNVLRFEYRKTFAEKRRLVYFGVGVGLLREWTSPLLSSTWYVNRLVWS